MTGVASTPLQLLASLRNRRLDPQRQIAADDAMRHGDIEDYLEVGRSGLEITLLGLITALAPLPRRILDLPCGHGRVLRWLAAAFPTARLFACDLDRNGVEFCEQTFAADGTVSTEDLSRVTLPNDMDLAFCGSLLTHLPKHAWSACIGLFERAITPGGLLVATTHGRWVRQRMLEGASYDLPPLAQQRAVTDFDQTGFGYADYARAPGYGISLCSPSWLLHEVQQRGTWEIIAFHERAWAQHQDVLVLRRL